MSNLIYKNTQYLNDDALVNIVVYALRTNKDNLDSPIQRIIWTAINGFNTVIK